MKRSYAHLPGDPTSPSGPTEAPAPQLPRPHPQDQGDLDDFIYDRDGTPSDL